MSAESYSATDVQMANALRRNDGRVHLVLPQTDGELTAGVNALEEVLAHHGAEDPAVDGRGAEADALVQLAVIVEEFDRDPTGSGDRRLPQPIAPDRVFELVPLNLASMPSEDRAAVLAGLDAIVTSGGPDGDEDLADMVEDLAGASRPHPAPAGSPGDQVRTDAARLAALLRIDIADDAYDIVALALGEPTVEARRVVLTVEEHAAYQLLQDRVVATWHQSDPVERFTYTG